MHSDKQNVICKISDYDLLKNLKVQKTFCNMKLFIISGLYFQMIIKKNNKNETI